MSSEKTPEHPAPGYTMGYNDDFKKMLERRSASTHAAHLLPLLKPGQRLLDLGCGPGTISMGLARAVEPGELRGIDMEESEIEIARAAAAAGGHHNAEFHVGDVTDLPFEDDSFDVVHCHALLMHVPDTEAALTEAKRVLRSGGIMSARDLIGESTFLEPEIEDIGGAWAAFLRLLEANGGHPQMGKELKRRFLDAGFSDIHATASFETYSTTADVDFFRSFGGGWFCSPATVESATKHGLATPEQFDGWRRMLDAWKDAPGALAALAFGEAIGRKP